MVEDCLLFSSIWPCLFNLVQISQWAKKQGWRGWKRVIRKLWYFVEHEIKLLIYTLNVNFVIYGWCMNVSFSFSEKQYPQSNRSAGKRGEGTKYCNVSKTRVRGGSIFFLCWKHFTKNIFEGVLQYKSYHSSSKQQIQTNLQNIQTSKFTILI